MSDLMLRTAVITRVTVFSMAQALAGVAHQAGERFRREQTGQDMVEYGGVLLLVALIVGAMIASQVPTHVANLLSAAANNVFSGQSSSVTAK
jgi:Flp pilus assembly pilin Flp